jgi:hypothetical protein
MVFDEQFYVRARSEAEQLLFGIPGVYGVALGPKIVAGKLTRKPAIQVFVQQKRSLPELLPSEIIPREIHGVSTDVIQGTSPLVRTAGTETFPEVEQHCRTGKITKVSEPSIKPVEITSAAHGLADGNHVCIFGVPLDETAAFPVQVKNENVFALPGTVGRAPLAVEADAFWTEPCAWEDNLCCCPASSLTGASNTNPVVITSPSHGLQQGDRIKIVRISGMTQIRGGEFVVGKTLDKDRFQLSGTDGSSFTEATHESGAWAKLCVDRTGLIQRVRLGTPIQITSQGHGLKRGDRVHIIHTGSIQEIQSGHKADPFTVDTITPDTFTLKGVARAGAAEDTSVGVWVRIFPDSRRYSRIRGGIRIAMQDSEAIKVQSDADSARPSGALVQRIRLSETVTVREVLTYGTLGCLAIDNETGAKVLLSNYHVLYSIDEDNVHHPVYSSCKSKKIAKRMRHADPGAPGRPGTVDAAIAKLDGGVKADPVIVDIGPVKGTAPITLREIVFDEANPNSDPRGYRVRKRGVTTLVTEGIVTGIHGTFEPTEENTERVFLRDQIVIRPMAGPGRGAFSLKGDSGSAVVNDKNLVVGLLVGNDSRTGLGFASPIGPIETQLNIKIWAAEPATPVAGTDGGTLALAEESDALVVTPSVPDLLGQVAEQLLQTPFGATLTSLVEQHHQEVEMLIHRNRRVAVAWHRNDGPALLRELDQFAEVGNVPLPTVINGRLLRHCLENIFAALQRFGSPQLITDIQRYAPDIFQLIGLSYSDVLLTLAARSRA